MELLIRKGAIVDLAAKEGCTPLFMASQQGEVDAMALLISHGANVLAKRDVRQNIYTPPPPPPPPPQFSVYIYASVNSLSFSLCVYGGIYIW
jgi:ankyrin repeat protein